MDLSTSPFRLSQFVWESQPGLYVLTAAVHATCRLRPGQDAEFVPPESCYCDARGNPSLHPVGYDEEETQVARANLFAPLKPRVDVCLVGKAYPDGPATPRLVARFRVGEFSKAVSVTGDRLWMAEAGRWASSPPRPFSQMWLTRERALRSLENPGGFDPSAIPVEGRLSMPNLEPSHGALSALFGPIPKSAPSRRNLLGTAANYWVSALEMGVSQGPLPEGMNFQYFNMAPVDQQLAEVSPGTPIVLENLHPQQAVFASRLPLEVPILRGLDPSTQRPLQFNLRIDTLWIDGDREIAWVVFRGSAPILRPELPVMLTVERQSVRAPEAERPSPLSTAKVRTTEGERTAERTAERPAEAPIEGDSYPPPPRPITQEIILPEVDAGLPFEASAVLISEPPESLEPAPTTPPFGGPEGSADGEERAREATYEFASRLAPTGSPGPVPRFDDTAEPPEFATLAFPQWDLQDLPPSAPPTEDATPVDESEFITGSRHFGAAIREEAPSADVQTGDRAEPSPTEPPAAHQENSLPLEACAAIRALLNAGPADRDAISATYGLSWSAFAATEELVLAAVEKSFAEGDDALLERYDTAFLEAQDTLRPRVTPETFITLLAARETSQFEAVLGAFGLSSADFARIDRSFRRRMERDPRLAEQILSRTGGWRRD